MRNSQDSTRRGSPTLARRRRFVRAVAVVGVATVGALLLAHLGGARPSQPSPAALAAARTIGPPVTSVAVSGDHVTVHVQSGRDVAGTTYAQWYGGLAAADVASRSSGLKDVSIVADTSSGPVVDDVAFNARVPLAGAAERPSIGAELQALQGRAPSFGARVTKARVVPVFGGALDVTLRPSDVSGFLAHAGENVGQILGPQGSDGRAYFVTVVDRSGGVQLMLSFNPAIGGTIGHGTAWVNPSRTTDAVWGPVTSRALAGRR
jgi:hypothetical protein